MKCLCLIQRWYVKLDTVVKFSSCCFSTPWSWTMHITFLTFNFVCCKMGLSDIHLAELQWILNITIHLKDFYKAKNVNYCTTIIKYSSSSILSKSRIKLKRRDMAWRKDQKPILPHHAEKSWIYNHRSFSPCWLKIQTRTRTSLRYYILKKLPIPELGNKKQVYLSGRENIYWSYK